MRKVSDIYAALDKIAPFASCESFDNVGVLIGNPEAPISRCLVTLDVTHDTVREALEKGCEMILSHHPIIFHPMKRIPFDSVQGELLKEGITVLSAHTNFDRAPEGLNASLATLLSVTEFTPSPEEECAGIGKLPGLSMDELIFRTARALSLQGMRYYDAGRPIHTVMICCGGGGSCIHEAIAEKADCLISGDFKHDQVIDAMNAGISCIDAGHYETERHFVPLCCKILGNALPDISFLPSETMRPGFIFRTFERKN